MAVSAVSPPFYPDFERSKTFATDFVYFIAREYGISWVPRSRPVDPLSPMTSDIEDGVRAFLRNNEEVFAEKYEALVPPGTPSNIGIFGRHSKQTFRRVVFTRTGTPEAFFESMVYVARLGVHFYERGVVHEAPEHAILIIAVYLWLFSKKVGPGLFPFLQVIGRDLAQRP